MKAKLYTTIFSALLLFCTPAKSQFADDRYYRNDEPGTVIKDYYDEYDYYYSSRINRFHRAYSEFSYYSPVFTETYWYSYQPHSWGTSIYGRSGRGFGFAINYPVYYYGWGTDYWYDYNFGWYDPYFGSSWYSGYDPFYYSWYSPLYINISAGRNWRSNYYYGWYGNNHMHNQFGPVHLTTNNYYINNNYYTSASYRQIPERTRSTVYNRSTQGSSVRRESVPAQDQGSQVNDRSNSGRGNTAQDGRNTENQPANNRGNNYSNQDNGSNNGNNRNSRPDGNNGNFDRNNRNNDNNGNNNHSNPDGNNGNFGDKGNRPMPPARTRPATSQPSRIKTDNGSGSGSTGSVSGSRPNTGSGSVRTPGTGSSSGRNESTASKAGRSSERSAARTSNRQAESKSSGSTKRGSGTTSKPDENSRRSSGR